MGDLGWGRHKLHQLLTNFVTPEVVKDVQCEGCNQGREPSTPPILSRQIKILNFGKVIFIVTFIEMLFTLEEVSMVKILFFVQLHM